MRLLEREIDRNCESEVTHLSNLCIRCPERRREIRRLEVSDKSGFNGGETDIEDRVMLFFQLPLLDVSKSTKGDSGERTIRKRDTKRKTEMVSERGRALSQ